MTHARSSQQHGAICSALTSLRASHNRELALLLVLSVTRRGERQEEGGGGGGRTARARAEAGLHGGEGDDDAEDDGDQEDGVHHGHLGHEEHWLDGRDDRALRRARGACGDGQARRAATQGAGYRLNGRRGHCRATRGPWLSRQALLNVRRAPKKLGAWRARGLCRQRRRGPTSAHLEPRACFTKRPSNHRDKHESLRTDVGVVSDDQCRGTRGRRGE
jgi:hypothetical protein